MKITINNFLIYSSHIQNFNGTINTSSIRERAEQAMQQKSQWEKIFKDLRKYLDDNLVMVVYDFSAVEDKISSSGSNMSVILKISPGVKIIPNRNALLVYKRVMDEWSEIKNNKENRSWINSVQGAENVSRANRYNSCYVKIGLYDEYGDSIATTSIVRRFEYSYNNNTFQVIAQQKYYDNQEFENFTTFSIPVKKISNTITPKIIEVGAISSDNSDFFMKLKPPIMTVEEWQDWLSQ
jgi:hypothetical protein